MYRPLAQADWQFAQQPGESSRFPVEFDAGAVHKWVIVHRQATRPEPPASGFEPDPDGQAVLPSQLDRKVENVGFRSTRIRTLDNSLISIPNNSVVNTTVENWAGGHEIIYIMDWWEE